MKLRTIFYSCIAVVVLFLTGCMSTNIVTKRDTNFKDQLSSLIIWETGTLQKQYPVLNERISGVLTSFSKELESRGVAVRTIATDPLELNTSELVNAEVRRFGAKQILLIQPTRATVRTTVEFYQYQMTLVDVKTRREVWRAVVDANWYSVPDEMAKNLITRLKQDGML